MLLRTQKAYASILASGVKRGYFACNLKRDARTTNPEKLCIKLRMGIEEQMMYVDALSKHFLVTVYYDSEETVTRVTIVEATNEAHARLVYVQEGANHD